MDISMAFLLSDEASPVSSRVAPWQPEILNDQIHPPWTLLGLGQMTFALARSQHALGPGERKDAHPTHR